MKCTSCEADLIPNKKFCGKCGQCVKIQIVDASKIRICSKCSSEVELTELHCPDCGSRVEEEQKIICQGKKTDGAICNAELSNSASFCSGCGTKRADTNDTFDDGKEDKNKKTDIVTGNQVKEHPAVYKPDPGKQEKPSGIQVEEQKRGLAVICTHSKFLYEGLDLSSRPSATDDLYMMKTVWELYGCQVISCPDKTNEFYNNQLISEIEAELEKLPDVEMFVFVLSTHGEEREEVVLRKENNKYVHYFYTNDGVCSTHDLMKKIAKIRKLDDKLKIFIIQACKSRSTGDNEDKGYELETIGKQVQSQDISPKDGTDERDAVPTIPKPGEGEIVIVQLPSESKSRSGGENEDHGYALETNGKQVQSQDIPQQDGDDKPDAIGNNPPPEENKIVIIQPPSEGMSNVCSSRPAPQPLQSKITPDLEKGIADTQTAPTSKKDKIKDVENNHTIQSVPLCDDCIVMFASMSGKFAYRKINSPLSGGWLIKAIEDVLKQHEAEEKVYILDMLAEVNREVGQKYTERDNLEIIPKMKVSEEGNKEELQKQLHTHMNSLKLIQENNSSRVKIRRCKEELNLLDERINQADTKDSLLKLKDEVLTLTQKMATELRSVTLKAQSNFFHNLAFDEEKLYLYKNKSDIHKIVKPVKTGP